jgi:hypothetical protein
VEVLPVDHVPMAAFEMVEYKNISFMTINLSAPTKAKRFWSDYYHSKPIASICLTR